MKVSGFTFLRNAVTNGYPFEESIKSILPIVDEFIVAIGIGQDDTRGRIEAINDKKIKIIDTNWNEMMQDRGYVYGQQKMIAQFNCSGDWVFYLEGDEVLHENELEAVRQTMRTNLSDFSVEALYFNFYHFYGTAYQIGIGGYRQAPRIIRNTIRTIAPDGLFWVVLDKNKKGRYPNAKFANANIYHYGHCRSVSKMNQKLQQVGRYWGHFHQEFSSYGGIDSSEIRPFHGSHPKIMREWIAESSEQNFQLDPNYRTTKRNLRNRIRFWIEDFFNLEISKKHFKKLD